ncbi:MAG: hypothetical protein KKE23_03290 [Nanoarchaeota archaeon]|nr:hypothetical protein [Nanoarchaeota archaeon]
MVKRTTEEKENPSEDDVRFRLKTLSPMLQQEYLENLLRRLNLDPNIRLMCSREVTELYVRRGLWANAAKIMESAAIFIHNQNIKKDIYKQAAVLYLRAMDLLLAEDCFRKTLENAMEKEKPFLKREIEQIHFTEAANMENIGKRAKAVEVYERMRRLGPDPILQRKINEKLVVLYENLGRIRDYIDLRDSMVKNQ